MMLRKALDKAILSTLVIDRAKRVCIFEAHVMVKPANIIIQSDLDLSIEKDPR